MERVAVDQWKGREVARLLALVESERRYYQEIVASFPVGAAIVNQSGAVVFSNRAFRKLMGVRAGDLQTRKLADLLPVPEIGAAVAEALHASKTKSGIAVEVGGAAFKASVMPISGWEEDPEGEALIALEASTSAGLHGVDSGEWPALLWTMDPVTLNYLTVEGSREHFHGYSARHWTSAPDFWRDRVHPEDRKAVTDFYRSAMRKSGEYGCEYRAMLASGKSVWCRDAFRVTVDATGKVTRITGITIDVDARRRAEQDNLIANRLEALSGLSRRVSHEFNNSLMVVTGYAEELLAHMNDADQRRTDVHAILSAAETMAGVTGELSGFTRKQATAATPAELSPVLSSVAARIRGELGATLVLRVPPQPLTASADAVQLEAVLMAIARRLRDKTDPHMIMTAADVSVDELSNLPYALRPGRYVEIAIRGPYTAEVPTSAFEMLITGKDPHASDLARAMAIVRDWGGTVYSQRSENASAVHVMLPHEESAESEPAPAEAPVVTVAPPPVAVEQPPAIPPAPLVIVLEDEAGIRGLVEKILTREGYRVLVAASGEEALEAARSSAQPVRLLITDLNLGGVSGRTIADEMARLVADLRVLYISGYNDDAIQSGAIPDVPFLQKPFTLAALTRKVHELLEPEIAAAATAGR